MRSAWLSLVLVLVLVLLLRSDNFCAGQFVNYEGRRGGRFYGFGGVGDGWMARLGMWKVWCEL